MRVVIPEVNVITLYAAEMSIGQKRVIVKEFCLTPELHKNVKMLF